MLCNTDSFTIIYLYYISLNNNVEYNVWRMRYLTSTREVLNWEMFTLQLECKN